MMKEKSTEIIEMGMMRDYGVMEVKMKVMSIIISGDAANKDDILREIVKYVQGIEV